MLLQTNLLSPNGLRLLNSQCAIRNAQLNLQNEAMPQKQKKLNPLEIALRMRESLRIAHCQLRIEGVLRTNPFVNKTNTPWLNIT